MESAFMQTDETVDRYFYIAGWIMIGLVLLYGFITCVIGFDISSLLPPCALHYVTGYYCPGCGGTRAINALLHGQFLLAAYYHPFVVYVLIVGGWFMISQTILRLSRGKAQIGLHFRMIYMWIGLGIIVLNCIAKNILLAVNGTVPYMD